MSRHVTNNFGSTTNVSSSGASSEAGELVVKVFVVTALSFLVAFIPTGIWFTFDDWLAEISGVAWLGEVPFWRAYCIVWFFMWAVTRPSAGSKK